jgi:hypothetical protein
MPDSYKTQTELDISYQYPPELLELLCDAVPCLFRSKQGVIDFFVGAGVPPQNGGRSENQAPTGQRECTKTRDGPVDLMPLE